MSAPARAAYRAFLDDLRDLLQVLGVSGLEVVDESTREGLQELAEVADAWSSHGAARCLRALDASLGGPKAADAWTEAWWRWWALSRALDLEGARARLGSAEPAAAPAPPPGWTGRFHPLGAVVRGRRIAWHGVDDDGEWRVFEEEAATLDPLDLWSRPTGSRLFQAEVRLGHALGRTWEVTSFPGVHTARRWVGRPAFHTQPRLAGPAVPPTPRSDRLERVEVVAERGPDGWAVSWAGGEVVVGEMLAYSLTKLAAFEKPPIRRVGWVVRSPGGAELLQWGDPPAFPTLDPRCERWSREALRRWATGGVGACVRALAGLGGPPPVGADPFDAAQAGVGVLGGDPVRLARGEGPARELLREAWLLRRAGALGEELALGVAQRGPPGPDDVLEGLLRVAACATPAAARTLWEAWVGSLTGADGPLPELEVLWWAGEVFTWLGGSGLPGLGVSWSRMRLAVARDAVGSAPPSDAALWAWRVAAAMGRLDELVEPPPAS